MEGLPFWPVPGLLNRLKRAYIEQLAGQSQNGRYVAREASAHDPEVEVGDEEPAEKEVDRDHDELEDAHDIVEAH